MDLNLTGETAGEIKRTFLNAFREKIAEEKSALRGAQAHKKMAIKKCRCRRTGGSNKSATFNSYFN
ncbi:hypothetical protein [Pseudoramibacter faecis]|uniref:hypothetical protein n=1 Tax=Pseudoramibacter faecis TaxID=3108534 RepID=UPI002E76C9E6|nr:hypothetical protein [Pseudoramibacter sp. HA2172]